MKTIHIKRIDPISASKTVLILYIVGALVIGGTNLLVQLLRGNPITTSIQFIPIFFVMIFTTSLTTLIVCLAYNLISMATGGIKIDIAESISSSNGATEEFHDSIEK